MESTLGEDTDKIVEVTTKELEYYINLVDKAAAGLVVLWVKGYQRALYTTENLLMKCGVSWCNKILCCLKKLLQPTQASAPPTWLVSSHQHQGKTLHQQKDYDSLEVQMMVSMSLVLCIFVLRYVNRYLRQFHCILSRLQNNVSITSISIGNQNNPCDLLYCDIHFIVVVWNQTLDISMYAFNLHKHDCYR